jgi:TonB family protein
MIQFDTYDWDYVPYRDLMLLKIYRYWVPQLRGTWQFNMGQAGRTIIKFTILRDGSVINVQLLDGSGIIQYDQAANYSIVQPYPGRFTAFPALPEHFPKSSLTVTIGFFVNMELPNRR